MINRGTSNNLDVSVDSFLAQFTDGLEEGGTSDATNKDNPHTEELLADEFDLDLGADQDLIEKQQQKENIQEQVQEEHQEHQEHLEQKEEQDQQTVNINQE